MRRNQKVTDFEVGVSPPQVTTLTSLMVIGIAEVEIKGFTIVTWPHDQKVTSFSGWSLPTVSYYFAKFDSHVSRDRKIKGHMTLTVGFPHLKLPLNQI